MWTARLVVGTAHSVDQDAAALAVAAVRCSARRAGCRARRVNAVGQRVAAWARQGEHNGCGEEEKTQVCHCQI